MINTNSGKKTNLIFDVNSKWTTGINYNVWIIHTYFGFLGIFVNLPGRQRGTVMKTLSFHNSMPTGKLFSGINLAVFMAWSRDWSEGYS